MQIKDVLIIVHKNAVENAASGRVNWENIYDSLSDNQKKLFNKTFQGNKIGSETAIIRMKVAFNKRRDYAESLKEMEGNPFARLAYIFGEEKAEIVLKYSKKKFLDRIDGNSHLAGETDIAFRMNRLEDAAKFLIKHLKEILPEDYSRIIFVQKYAKFFKEKFFDYFSDDEKKYIENELKKRSGLFVAKPISPEKISNRGTASHAMGVAAFETGEQAQGKQPKSRKDKIPVNPRGKPQDPSA